MDNEIIMVDSLFSVQSESMFFTYMLDGDNPSNSSSFIVNIQEEETGATQLKVVGFDLNGIPFNETIIDSEGELESSINPTKVFKYVAKKLKQLLCPSCS